ncbi:hypothetical protein ACVIHH_008001 [Bradyrhizobium sp. USDA 4518]
MSDTALSRRKDDHRDFVLDRQTASATIVRTASD